MHLDMFRLRRGSGQHWQRVFRGAGPGEDDGWFWTPCPLAALTFVEPDGGQLLVGTLRLRGLEWRKEDDWTHDAHHPGDSLPPRDGTDIQCYVDRAKQGIFWHFGENRRVDLGGEPDVRDVARVCFVAYRLVSEKIARELEDRRRIPVLG